MGEVLICKMFHFSSYTHDILTVVVCTVIKRRARSQEELLFVSRTHVTMYDPYEFIRKNNRITMVISN